MLDYSELCENLLAKLCTQTTIAEDKKLVETSVMVVYRLERKLIVKSHIELCHILTEALKAKSKAEYTELISTPRTHEEPEELFYLRRLRMRDYLETLSELY